MPSDTCHSTSSIIAAFTSVFDVFKKFRSQNQCWKRSKPEQDAEELVLSKSLRRSPVEIQDEYERGYQRHLERFANGDEVAHASLAKILLKLNTGLVEIVSAFLANSKHKTPCDYRPLIQLSDDSRREAIDTLYQLQQRLSQSEITPLHPRHTATRGSRTKKTHVTSPTRSKAKSAERTTCKPASPKLDNSRLPSAGTTVGKVSVKGAGMPQYAFVRRPRHGKRTVSGSSASSGNSSLSISSRSSHSTTLTTPSSSPCHSPDLRSSAPPPYTARDNHWKEQESSDPKTVPKRKPVASQKQRPSPEAERRSATVVPDGRARTAPPKPPKPEAYSHSSNKRAIPTPVEHVQQNENIIQPLRANVQKPRFQAARNSVAYSFASDSTKLGEIPLHKWTEQFDFEAMDRLNEEAAINGWIPPPPDHGGRKRRGFLGLFKKASE
ncbi:MAG: hypothetical protein M1820_005739 [Bogoriella megaspora]|nr:MAG: hypothetical protein M1820_005739 [Bogoriella megaspora]